MKSDNMYNSIRTYTGAQYHHINTFNRKLRDWDVDSDYFRRLSNAEKLLERKGINYNKEPNETFNELEKRIDITLRDIHASQSIRMKQEILYWTKNIDSSIEEFILKDNIKLYRAVDKNALPPFKNLSDLVGKEYKDDSYMSTSVKKDGIIAGDYILNIGVKAGKGKGAFLKQVSWHPNEDEFLLKRQLSFVIKDAKKINDEIHIFMEEKWLRKKNLMRYMEFLKEEL